MRQFFPPFSVPNIFFQILLKKIIQIFRSSYCISTIVCQIFTLRLWNAAASWRGSLPISSFSFSCLSIFVSFQKLRLLLICQGLRTLHPLLHNAHCCCNWRWFLYLFKREKGLEFQIKNESFMENFSCQPFLSLKVSTNGKCLHYSFCHLYAQFLYPIAGGLSLNISRDPRRVLQILKFMIVIFSRHLDCCLLTDVYWHNIGEEWLRDYKIWYLNRHTHMISLA